MRVPLLIVVAFIVIFQPAYSQNNSPVAVNDYDTTDSGGGGIFQVLNNDTDPDGNNLILDTAWMDTARGNVQVLGGFIISYNYNMLYYGIDTIYYVVCDDTIPTLCDTGMLIVTVNYKMFEAYEYLDINMVKARFNADGADFWNNQGGGAGFEVPKGGGRHTVFLSSLWIAGKDSLDSLHLAATRYNGAGQDIYTGPIMDSIEYSFSQDSLWNKLWKINKTDIDYHITNWNQPGYIAIDDIATWPGNGDTAKGQAVQLAPYYDRMGDQIYDAYDGDYPLIKGDQAVYFIRNDDRYVHEESGGEKMKIEIHGTAYAFNCLNDVALNYTIFVNYKIVNRSVNNYDSTFIGINFDPDIGDAWDDYIECDVNRGSVFAFNGKAVDGSGAPSHYGQYPPAQSVTFLRGPRMDADGSDNPDGGCDESINGLGFGDGVVDNEHLGMSNFTAYCNPGIGCNSVTQGDPETSFQYYNYLRSYWKDGSSMKYGGNGHDSTCTSCEETRFMFPNTSDQCNWGTNSVTPGDTTPWNEQNAGTAPGDRRGVGSMGPFTFNTGDTIEIDIAYVYGRDMTSTNPYSSVIVMKENIDSVRSYFNKNLTPCGDAFTAIEPQSTDLYNSSDITLYPNPATGSLNVVLPEQNGEYKYNISDLAGRIVQTGLIGKTNTIDINKLGHGIFILRVQNEGRSFHGKFVKM